MLQVQGTPKGLVHINFSHSLMITVVIAHNSGALPRGLPTYPKEFGKDVVAMVLCDSAREMFTIPTSSQGVCEIDAF